MELTYDEAIRLLEDMKGRFNDGFSSLDHSIIEQLYGKVLNRVFTRTGCNDCYRDAYVLIYSTLKRTKEMPTRKSQYILKAGALLRKPGSNKFYANPLPNDEVPESYLAEFPNQINLFASYPHDWEERVKARKEGRKVEVAPSPDIAPLNAEISRLKAESDEKDKLIAELKSVNAEQGEVIDGLRTKIQELQSIPAQEDAEEIGNLKMQLDMANADLKAANEEIEPLRAANEALKANKTARSKKA